MTKIDEKWFMKRPKYIGEVENSKRIMDEYYYGNKINSEKFSSLIKIKTMQEEKKEGSSTNLGSSGNSAELEKKLREMILSSHFADKDIRPWGGYITLWEDEKFKVKILFVLPKRRLSLQRHKYRKEKWVIAEGRALITKGNKRFIMEEGNTVMIEEGELHRIENVSENKILKIVEVWMGEKLLEDDIERIEDDFGRV